MPNNCCVCGAKIGKQYYQLSKNHPEEHLCPDCAEEIQSIYDLASSADPDFRRHMRRFSGKLEDGAASGAAIGYLEHFFQSCSRLYRDQLENESRTAEAETSDMSTESVGSASEEEVPEDGAIDEAEPETAPEADFQGEEILQPANEDMTADSLTRIKRIGIRRTETVSEAAIGHIVPDPQSESSESMTQKQGKETDPETEILEYEEAEFCSEEKTNEETEKEYWSELEGSQRKKKAKKAHPKPEREKRTQPEKPENEEDTVMKSGNPGTGFLRVMAGVLPVACGAAGGLIGSLGSDMVRTALAVVSGLAIGLSGTACMLATAKCLDRVQEMMDSIQSQHLGKQE